MTDRKLIDSAAEVVKNSYTPYSRRKSGAALECTNGAVYTGCIIENSAIGTTMCAEAAAVAAAVSAGNRNFKRLAIRSEGSSYNFPCGNCRQILNEFSPEMEILCARGDGRYVSYQLSALLPMPFESESFS
jgi:cytidine deaminase